MLSIRTSGLVLPFVLFAATAVSASSIDVMAAKDDSFCAKAIKFFGEHLLLDVDLQKTVVWTPVELKGQGPRTSHCSKLDRAIVDLDNDGRQDLVIKTSFCMKGGPSDSLYLFPEDSSVLDEATWQDMSPLLATPHKFERTGGAYPLTSLHTDKVPPALMTLFTIQPFVADGVTYVSLSDARREWMAIARFLGGQQFEDQCYLRASKF